MNYKILDIFIFTTYNDECFEFRKSYKKIWRWKILQNLYLKIFISKWTLLKKIASEKKDLVLFGTNLKKKTPDPTKAKEQYELFLKNQGKQIHKTSNNGDIKPVAVKHPETTSYL